MGKKVQHKCIYMCVCVYAHAYGTSMYMYMYVYVHVHKHKTGIYMCMLTCMGRACTSIRVRAMYVYSCRGNE